MPLFWTLVNVYYILGARKLRDGPEAESSLHQVRLVIWSRKEVKIGHMSVNFVDAKVYHIGKKDFCRGRRMILKVDDIYYRTYVQKEASGSSLIELVVSLRTDSLQSMFALSSILDDLGITLADCAEENLGLTLVKLKILKRRYLERSYIHEQCMYYFDVIAALPESANPRLVVFMKDWKHDLGKLQLIP